MDKRIQELYVIASYLGRRVRYVNWTMRGHSGDIPYTYKIIFARRFNTEKEAKDFIKKELQSTDLGDRIEVVPVIYTQEIKLKEE